LAALEAQYHSKVKEYRHPQFECTKCKKLPSSNPIEAFCCSQKHVFCHDCLLSTSSCPICKEHFSSFPPTRNSSIERKILKILQKQKREELDEEAASSK